MRLRYVLGLLVVVVVAGLLVAGWQVFGGANEGGATSPDSVAKAKASATTAAATRPAAKVPTKVPTPIGTPTPAPPTATPTPSGPTPTPTITPTPAPSYTTTQAAAALQQQVVELQQALAIGDRESILKLQKDLLAALPDAEAAAQADPAPGAEPFREALAELQDGLSGDTTRLASASQKLAAFTGENVAANGTPGAYGLTGTPAPAVEPITDIPRYAGDLADKVEAFQTAQGGDLLRLQEDVLTELQRGETVFGRSTSPQTETLRSGLQDLRQAMGGDTVKFDSAVAKLQQVAGQSAGNTGTATSQTQANSVDVQPIANELNNRLGDLQNAVNSHDQQALENARKALNEQLDKAQSQLANANSAKAKALQNALGPVREAAAGDNAKLDAARAALQQALSGQ